MTPIRVLVVDDSALMRKLIPQLLGADPGIEVVGTAMDGIYALQKIAALSPDVVTLDVDMPRLNGIETLRAIRASQGPPVVVVSSLSQRDAELTFQALAVGAFDFVAKPHAAISTHIHEIGVDLVGKVRAAAAGGASRPQPAPRLSPRSIKSPQAAAPAVGAPSWRAEATQVLVVGVSTGGPNALSYLLPQLPEDFPAAILVVQHLPPGFTGMFAARLDAGCRIEVKEAREGDLVLPGRVLIAPGDRHLTMKRLPLGTVALLSDAAPTRGHRPSADVLFNSAAEEFGPHAAGLIMTGMGDDGAAGIGEIRRRGGFTMAQDEESCVVYGMPRAAIERGVIDRVLGLEQLPQFLERLYVERGMHA
ncbi:MAG: protein-glutamate methylesterase/protein-glutamine glutaminase [Candidatus Methylomirabilia bacterium]